MKKLFIVERLSEAKAFLHENINDNTCDLLTTSFTGVWKNKLKKISFDQVPYTVAPPANVNEVSLSEIEFPTVVSTTVDGARKIFTSGVNGEDKSELMAELNNLKELVKDGKYEEVIVMYGDDAAGCWTAHSALKLLDIPESVKVTGNRVIALDKQSASNTLNSREAIDINDINSYLVKRGEGQRCKFLFDHWWNSNSAIVLSEAAKWAGITANPVITKFELVLMQYLQRSNDVLAEYEICTLMEKWKGTGKYKNKSFEYDNDVRLGSAASSSQIIKQAAERGFLVRVSEESNGNPHYKVSNNGELFCSLLHKSSYDADLPYRIDRWKSYPNLNEMERYIRQFFGRQLRYQRKIKGQLGLQSS
ncbi:hypothetical protein [Vibrio crassostreae]|uniref:hypothetical protein n=1 Tax=Vibrio crassostreae TaxID=246167 RepID=UPI001B3045A3|nr:hypothetical protein [Vibrio crassostreae]